jgi:hypothetical protein
VVLRYSQAASAGIAENAGRFEYLRLVLPRTVEKLRIQQKKMVCSKDESPTDRLKATEKTEVLTTNSKMVV